MLRAAVPDQTHVGRRYTASGQRIAPEAAARMAAAIAGPDPVAEPDAVPPTFAAVYCLGPTFAQLFTDPEVGIDLAGLIHGDQSFEWPEPVRAGDVVDATTEIVGVDLKRGMTFVRLAMEAVRPADQAVVCRGTALMIVRAAA
jgi:acyl dehydratase